MGHWKSIFGNGEDASVTRLYEESRRLLPVHVGDTLVSALPAKEVTKVALRLKYQIERVIPCELDIAQITSPNSSIITKSVVETAREAGGDDYRTCVVYCLLVCLRWFKAQAAIELWDSELYFARAIACEVIAKHIIETEHDQDWLLKEVLLKRFSIYRHGKETLPINVVERATDLHALRIIGSSGYQKCIQYIWRGWLTQDDEEPSVFVEYNEKANTSYWAHFDPDRMRTPVYQNAVLIFFSILYLVLYTAVINSVNPSGDVDIAEGILYTMTLAYICDEVTKFYKIGKHHLGFSNLFNNILYLLLTISFILRIAALGHSSDTHDEVRRRLNVYSYNFLAFTAPMFWMRLLLFLDTFRFFGAMLVVLKVMMKESIIFFALLIVVLVGFLQAFIGLEQAEFTAPVTRKIMQGMLNSLMQSPEFSDFNDFAPPFGLVLYYIYTFVVMVLLLNILIALYNTSYSDISGNAIDEYLALFSQKTLQFVRAPDENVFIPPFNLIEILCLSLPFEWWLPKDQYQRINNYVMGFLYSPVLLITAWVEVRTARRIRANRRHGDQDDTIRQEWEALISDVDFDVSERNWDVLVQETQPNVEVPTAVLEVRDVKEQVNTLMGMVKQLVDEKDGQGRTTNGA